jgi:hypothetical protein
MKFALAGRPPRLLASGYLFFLRLYRKQNAPLILEPRVAPFRVVHASNLHVAAWLFLAWETPEKLSG